jgi:Family of unknown function (DUF6111)
MATKHNAERKFRFSAWPPPRLIWLTVAALGLVIAGFAVLVAQFGGAPPSSTYVPAHMEDGRFMPGAQR